MNCWSFLRLLLYCFHQHRSFVSTELFLRNWIKIFQYYVHIRFHLLSVSKPCGIFLTILPNYFSFHSQVHLITKQSILSNLTLALLSIAILHKYLVIVVSLSISIAWYKYYFSIGEALSSISLFLHYLRSLETKQPAQFCFYSIFLLTCLQTTKMTLPSTTKTRMADFWVNESPDFAV